MCGLPTKQCRRSLKVFHQKWTSGLERWTVNVLYDVIMVSPNFQWPAVRRASVWCPHYWKREGMSHFCSGLFLDLGRAWIANECCIMGNSGCVTRRYRAIAFDCHVMCTEYITIFWGDGEPIGKSGF